MTPQQIIEEIKQHADAGAKVEVERGQKHVDTPIRVAPTVDALQDSISSAFNPDHQPRRPKIVGYDRTNLKWIKQTKKERKAFLLAQREKWSGDDPMAKAVRAQCDALLAEMKT